MSRWGAEQPAAPSTAADVDAWTSSGSFLNDFAPSQPTPGRGGLGPPPKGGNRGGGRGQGRGGGGAGKPPKPRGNPPIITALSDVAYDEGDVLS